MKKNTPVKWVTSLGVHGTGVVISDEVDGHVLVAVDNAQGEEHHVIYCTVTWLTAREAGD